MMLDPTGYMQSEHWKTSRYSIPFNWLRWTWYQRQTPWHKPDPVPPEVWFKGPRLEQKGLVVFGKLSRQLGPTQPGCYLN